MPNLLYDTLFAPGRDSDRTFLTDVSGQALSYRDFHALAARQANVLASAGLVPGDRLAVQVEKTPEALAKSYAELERLRHYPGVENEEQMARFRRMAGLPESEEDYRLERPESTPESEWNAGLAERMARTAYRYGVPPEAMNALQETMAQAYEEAREQMADSRMEMETQAEQSLQQEWGANYERNMGRATAALQRLASETGVDADALLDNPGLGSNPDVIRLLYQASRLLDEAPLHHSGAATPSPAEEAMRMESDPSHPLYEAYMNVNHPNHRYANELYDRLTSR